MTAGISIGKAFFLVAFVALAGFTGYRETTRDRFELPYGRLLGENWLRMTRAQKIYFVEGYRRGTQAGHADACALCAPLDPQKFPPVVGPAGILQDPCLARSKRWSKGGGFLVDQIDAFYQRYPEKRDVHLTNVIDNLSDHSGLTIERDP